MLLMFTLMNITNLIIFKKSSFSTRNSSLLLFINLSGIIDGLAKLFSYLRSPHTTVVWPVETCREISLTHNKTAAIHQAYFHYIWSPVLHCSLTNGELVEHFHSKISFTIWNIFIQIDNKMNYLNHFDLFNDHLTTECLIDMSIYWMSISLHCSVRSQSSIVHVSVEGSSNGYFYQPYIITNSCLPIFPPPFQTTL